jgi:hypothetical protein
MFFLFGRALLALTRNIKCHVRVCCPTQPLYVHFGQVLCPDKAQPQSPRSPPLNSPLFPDITTTRSAEMSCVVRARSIRRSGLFEGASRGSSRGFSGASRGLARLFEGAWQRAFRDPKMHVRIKHRARGRRSTCCIVQMLYVFVNFKVMSWRI